MAKSMVSLRSTPRSVLGLVEMLGTLGRDHLRIVEVGSYAGESAEAFLCTGRVDRLFCIDPWGGVARDIAARSDMAKVEATFDQRVSGDCRVVKAKGTLDQFVESLRQSAQSDTDYFDGVYIDALHDYESVLHDVDVALTGLRPRLFIAGHDYNPDRFPGVVRAVRERFGEPDAVLRDTSWIVNLQNRSCTVPGSSMTYWRKCK